MFVSGNDLSFHLLVGICQITLRGFWLPFHTGAEFQTDYVLEAFPVTTLDRPGAMQGKLIGSKCYIRTFRHSFRHLEAHARFGNIQCSGPGVFLVAEPVFSHKLHDRPGPGSMVPAEGTFFCRCLSFCCPGVLTY